MESNYIINPKISWRFIEDEILILDSNGKQAAHDLNQIGSFIFEKIDQGLQTQEIIRLLNEQYPSQSTLIESDFKSFIRQLLDNQIILLKED